jgi:hypothetical protein
MKIDDWFKPIIVILAIIFVVIFYLSSLNGRFVPFHFGDITLVLDSRTGILYEPSGEKVYSPDKK